MAQDANRLIWIDMEMTGLSPEADRIIEVALVVTDQDLNVLAEGPVRVVHQGEDILDAMDSWNKGTHGRSGLIDRVKAATASEAEVEEELIRFLAALVPPNASPMCGNSVCQDRRFLARYMSRLEAYFHYRNLDVSTLKELARRWKPEVMAGFSKQSKHEALADVYESIQELRYYRGQLLRI
jgi:oligoribonuclease